MMPSAITDTISRYHLDDVEIGVNIAEEQGWTSSLALTCRYGPSHNLGSHHAGEKRHDRFDGKTMFSFRYDFSDLGDPSTLSEQADLNCWASGTDDAGWALVSSTGNSELDPWLEAPLNNIGPDLALENVVLEGDLKAGEKIRLSFFVTNGGETLETPFNATIEMVQGDERSMVGRAVFYSMDANTAKSVKRSFTAPEGPWTLEITVDSEGLIWEIDETNNVWSRTVSDSSSGFGAATVMLGGGGLLALVGVGVLLRRRGVGAVEEEKVVAALKATGEARRLQQRTNHLHSLRQNAEDRPAEGGSLLWQITFPWTATRSTKSRQGRGRTHTTGTRSHAHGRPRGR